MKETPKNIRQIGAMDPNHKIYVEDYVITYTRNLGEELMKENDEGYRAAVLLGMKDIQGKEIKTYVSGMVRIENFSLSGESVFSNEIWSGIYDKIKSYFEDEEIVGWMFISNMDSRVEESKLINIHSSNFNGKNMIFIRYNCEDHEEKAYDYINNQFIFRKGFYVYYEKNVTMQNYMLAGRRERKQEYEPADIVQDVREVINRRNEEHETRRLVRSIYATGMLVAAVALLIGSTAIYNMNNNGSKVMYSDEETKSVFNNEEAVSGAAIKASDASAGIAAVMEYGIQPASETGEKAEDVEPADEPAAATAAAASDGDREEASDDAVQTAATPEKSFYIVKNGDSLGRISENIYNSVDYVEMLMKANNLKDPDMIFEGQKLKIPDKSEKELQ